MYRTLEFTKDIVFQKCEQRFGESYRLYGQNKQIEDFDFLIWSGIPGDLSRLMFPRYPILQNQVYHQATSSVVEMRSVIKGSHTQFYAKQLFSEFYDNKVSADFDSFAAAEVL